MAIIGDTNNKRAFCDRCGEPIKNIYVWGTEIYGSECIVRVLNDCGMNERSKPSWLKPATFDQAEQQFKDYLEVKRRRSIAS